MLGSHDEKSHQGHHLVTDMFILEKRKTSFCNDETCQLALDFSLTGS